MHGSRQPQASRAALPLARRRRPPPAGLAAVPGPLKLHPYQRTLRRSEDVSVLKSARIGYTRAEPVLVLMPTQDDCRGLMVDQYRRAAADEVIE